MTSLKVVIPVKTGVQMACNCLKRLDSDFRQKHRKGNPRLSEGLRDVRETTTIKKQTILIWKAEP